MIVAVVRRQGRFCMSNAGSGPRSASRGAGTKKPGSAAQAIRRHIHGRRRLVGRPETARLVRIGARAPCIDLGYDDRRSSQPSSGDLLQRKGSAMCDEDMKAELERLRMRTRLSKKALPTASA